MVSAAGASKLPDARTGKIVVLGLGYVGLPLLIQFGKAGFPVIGFDIDKKKILIDHIKTTGEHSAKIKLDEGVVAVIKIIVTAAE